jgi:DNA-binding NarL/FixJ family response regulator
MQKVRLILASPMVLRREGIKAILKGTPGVEIVGEARGGHEAVGLVARRRPDVAILDEALPGLNGVEATARMLKRAPGLRVVILAEDGDAVSVSAALRAGARGYLLRNVTAQDLRRALRSVLAGEVYLGTGLSKRLLQSPRSRPDLLTPRQREVLQMIAEGWSTKQIAKILRISVKTVETHRAQLMERLGIFDVPGLVRYALKTKLSRL